MQSSQAEQMGSAVQAVQARQMNALPLLYPILRDLQVREITNQVVPSEADIDLGRMALVLVLNRLMAPQPLYQVQEWFGQTVLPEGLGIGSEQVYDNRLGRALDQMHPHLGELWARLASRAVQQFDLDLSVLHWDITSIYFEGAYTDSELARYGYSRDHRPDTKQVNLEVDVTHEGYVPVLYEVLPGNTADITRPEPHLQALLRFLARPELAGRGFRPTLVSDSKMLTAQAVWACHQHQLGYLGPLPNSTASQALLESVSPEELAAHQLSYRPQRVKPDDDRFVPYQGVWRPYEFSYQGKTLCDRALVVWSAGKQRLDQQKRRTQLKRLLDGLASIQAKLNTRRYKKRDYVEQRLATVQKGNPAREWVKIRLQGKDAALRLDFQLDRQQLEKAHALDGRYALATNDGSLSADQALQLFKGQDGVEKRFRAVKGPLLVHPLFVRTDARIEGLVLITLLALLVRALLERACRQQELKVTCDRLFKGFAFLQTVDLIWSDQSCQRRVAQMTEFQSQVLGTLGWPPPEVYASMTPWAR